MENIQEAEVIIFKAETDKTPDPYVEELEKSIFRPSLVPVITFDFYNLNGLKEKLQCHDAYSGLILSSERCVQAVHRSIMGSEAILDNWKSKPVVCAGEATAKKARDLLELDPILGEKHRGEGIIELLSEMNPMPNCVLYPCGELAANKDTLASGLAEKGISCDSVLVYKTVPNPKLKNELRKRFPENEENWPQILVFFSPSGLKAVLENIENCESLNTCKLVSIGPTTTKAIKDRGFPVWAEAETPNPQSLRAAVERATLPKCKNTNKSDC